MIETVDFDFDAPPEPAPARGLVLRDYQIAAKAAVAEGWAIYKRQLIDAATGTGKTTLFASIAADEWKSGGRTLILENRDALVRQTAKRIADETGLGCEVEMAGEHATPFAPVVVASVQTLCRDARLTGFADNHFALLVTDEAHHACARSYEKVTNYFHFGKESLQEGWLEPMPDVNYEAKARVLGVTATPEINGSRHLSEAFQRIAFQYQLLHAVQDGWLVPPVTKNIPLKIDLRGLRPGRTPNGSDFKAEDLSAKMVPILEALALQIVDMARNRKVMAFTPSVECARILAAAIDRNGMRGIFVSGECLDVNAKTEEYRRAGPGTVLCNCALYVEGADFPDTDCVVMARATKSSGFYRQCLDSETEILTSAGWTKDVRVGDSVAAFDPLTEGIVFTSATDVIRRPVGPDEHFVSLKSQSCDIRITGGHRMLYDHKRRTGWKFKTADQLAALRHTSLIPVAGIGSTQTGVPLTDDELRFLGWITTDGWVNKVTKGAAICQGEHQPWIGEIDKCLIGCGFKFKKSARIRKSQFKSNSRAVQWTISFGKPRMTDKHLTGWGRLAPWYSKTIADSLMSMSPRQFEVFIEAIHLGDGHKQVGQSWTQRSYHICTGRKVFADRLQILAVLSGHRASVSTNFYNKNDIHVVHIKKQRFIRVGGKTKDRPSWVTETTKLGETCWCVTNELGTLVTRRHGKVAIMGNCIGRGTRTLKGVVEGLETPAERRAAIAASAKPNLLILDPLWISDRIDLCDAYDLYTDKPEVKEIMKKTGLSPESAEVAERDFIKALEKEARKHARKAARTIDPLAWAVSLGDATFATYVPEPGWESAPPSAGQLEFLRKQGMDTKEIRYKGLASKIIGRVMTRINLRLATPHQLSLMHKLGLDEQTCAKLTIAEATATIDRTIREKRFH